MLTFNLTAILTNGATANGTVDIDVTAGQFQTANITVVTGGTSMTFSGNPLDQGADGVGIGFNVPYIPGLPYAAQYGVGGTVSFPSQPYYFSIVIPFAVGYQGGPIGGGVGTVVAPDFFTDVFFDAGQMSTGPIAPVTVVAGESLGSTFYTANPFFSSDPSPLSSDSIVTCPCGLPNADANYNTAGDTSVYDDSSYSDDGASLDASADSSVGWDDDSGDPVSIGTGNLYERVIDYRTAGANRLEFIRYYNSLTSGSAEATMLGQHWRSNFDRYLNTTSATSTVAERPDGKQLTFTLSNGAWVSDSDVDVVLTHTGFTWTLTDTTDTVETYIAVSTTEAILSSIKTRNGYSQTLQFNSGSQPSSVTDSFGRTLTFTYQNRLLQTVTAPDGLILTYTYSSGNLITLTPDRLTSVAYSTTPSTSRTYQYLNSFLPYALTGIVDENQNLFATWTYDQSGRALTSQHAGGADLTTFVYSAEGSCTVTNALGQQTRYMFTMLQGVPKLSEIDRLAAPAGPGLAGSTVTATRTFTYDANGYIASATDWNGNLTAYANDAHGRPITIIRASGTAQARTSTLAYHPTLHLPLSVVTSGLAIFFTYDSNGNVLTKTLTDTTTSSTPYSTRGTSRIWTYTWSNFLLASVLGPRSDVKSLKQYGYDSTGALTSITNALGQITKITQHLPGGLPQKIIDPNGVTTIITYDARGRRLTRTIQTAAGNLTTTNTYDAVGNLLSTALPDGSALTNTYDNAHRLIATTDLFKQSISYTLDAHGNRIKTTVTNASQAVTKTRSDGFDALARVATDTGGAGQQTLFSYDSNGNRLTVTNALGRVTTSSYDPLNRATQIVDAGKGNSTFAYDSYNRPLAITDPTGNTTFYTYDGFGDLIQEVSPARGTTVYTYDPDGNVTQRTDGRGAAANYTYDALDRLLTIKYPADPPENVTYTYDQATGGFGIGRLTTVTDSVGTLTRTYDERGNLLTETRSGAATVPLVTTYTYDPASRISSIQYPSSNTISYVRDAMGRLTGVMARIPGTVSPLAVASNVAYEPFGPVSGLTFGNGIAETRTFDADYRLTGLSATGNAAVQGLSYGYDVANNVLSLADGVTPGNSQTFGIDPLNRLQMASGAYGTINFGYDPNGNRTTESPASELMDGLGTVSSLTYNQAGRLSAVNAGATPLTQYTYDAFGHRIVKIGLMSAMTLYQYDRSGHLLSESDNQGDSQADYIYLAGRPVAEIADGGLVFLHTDRLGTPQMATNSGQAVVWVGNYQPFGALTASSQTSMLRQDLRLPGQENDAETGFYHNGFRDYAPWLGRYSQSDPIGVAGGLNQHTYAMSSPLKFRDFTGLAPSLLTAVTFLGEQVEQRASQQGEALIGNYEFQTAWQVLQAVLNESDYWMYSPVVAGLGGFITNLPGGLESAFEGYAQYSSNEMDQILASLSPYNMSDFLSNGVCPAASPAIPYY